MRNTEQYTVKRADGDIIWDLVPVLDIGNRLWNTDTDIRARAQLCYDENALYVHMSADEKNIRAELQGPLQPVCQDSCLEFFFCPDGSDDRYINFEINPNCATFIGVGHGREDNIRVCPEREEALFKKKSCRTETGWEVFYTLPVIFLRALFPNCVLSSGVRIRANLYKCGDCTENPHYLSWNTVVCETPDFHRVQDFGVTVLE